MKSTMLQEGRLQEILRTSRIEKRGGIWACCSSNPFVLRAACRYAARENTVLLAESSSAQVNQYGGYSGMTPGQFCSALHMTAQKEGLPADRLILGADHAGPLPWRQLNETEAMRRAERLIADCVEAGYEKIHIDVSMPLGEERLSGNHCDSSTREIYEDIMTERGVRLIAAAENAWSASRKEERTPPLYVIGNEVPESGGIQQACQQRYSSGEHCLAMLKRYRERLQEAGYGEAAGRIIAMAADVGTGFFRDGVLKPDVSRLSDLSEVSERAGIVFEGHSADYLDMDLLQAMTENGISILKVGPELTNALLKALFFLENLERKDCGESSRSRLKETLFGCMIKDPVHLHKWMRMETVGETEVEQMRKIAFGPLDRWRYYANRPEVQKSVCRLLKNLSGSAMPAPEDFLIKNIMTVIEKYDKAAVFHR